MILCKSIYLTKYLIMKNTLSSILFLTSIFIFAFNRVLEIPINGSKLVSEIEMSTLNDTIPFEMKFGRPFVKVFVNGQGPFDFAVDIGASGIGRINMPLFKELNLPFAGEQSNSDGVNTTISKTVTVDKLQLGTIMFSNQELIMRDYGVPISGILARDFFADRLLIIDYYKKQLVLANNTHSETMGECMPYEREFRVKGTIGGLETIMNFDTGSNLAMVVPKSFLDIHKISYTETGTIKQGKGTNTEFELVEAILNEELVLNNTMYQNLKFYYTYNFNEIRLGGPFFEDKVIVIDQKNKCLKLIKH